MAADLEESQFNLDSANHHDMQSQLADQHHMITFSPDRDSDPEDELDDKVKGQSGMQYGYFACVLASISYDHTVLIKSDLAIITSFL